MNPEQEKVIKYYNRLGSRLGYDYILGGALHFGYYPERKKNISEKRAQEYYHGLVGNTLNLKSGELILDAGCGQGAVACFLAKNFGAKVVGINIVPLQLKKACTLAKRMSCENGVEFLLMDYAATNFKNNYFDAIYTTETLSHAPDVRKTLKEFLRILKPGGRIALFEYTIAEDKMLNGKEKKMLDTVISGAAMMGLKQFRHNKFPDTLRGVGFIKILEQDISKNVGPSFHRLHIMGRVPYKIVRALRLQKFFPNITASFEYYKLAEKGLIRYCIFTAKRP